jgi:uncharacterized repeat protein (TIGR02543 family)
VRTVDFGDRVKIPAKKPVRTGYKFLGWARSSVAKSAGYKAGDRFTVRKKVTFYAVWKLKKGYKQIAFNSTGGAKVYAKAVKKGKSAGKLPTPERYMYRFKGWYTKKEGGRKYSASSKVGKNVRLYARWEASEEAKIVELVNKERKKVGLNPLKADKELTRAARVRAEEIHVRWGHTRPDGTPCNTASRWMAGENILWVGGIYIPPSDAMDIWMNSPSHKESILRPHFKTIGVALNYKNGATAWVQCFGDGLPFP